MAPSGLCAFAAGAPLARAPAAAPARCATRMAADGGKPAKKESLLDWVLSKTMPHQEEGDVFGYEPFFKQSMEAREEAKKEEYKKRDGK